MKIAITGHRPHKLYGGYDLDHPSNLLLKGAIKNRLEDLMPEVLYTGMALGVDQIAAIACDELKIPFIAAIPCDEQDKMWRNQSKTLYHTLLAKAQSQVIVSPGPYNKGVMQIRNEWMVDRADIILAVWNGTDGGTANCVRDAKKKEKRIIVIHPLTLEVTEEA